MRCWQQAGPPQPQRPCCINRHAAAVADVRQSSNLQPGHKAAKRSMSSTLNKPPIAITAPFAAPSGLLTCCPRG